MSIVKTPNLIIGAGPAGLGMAGSLTKAGLEFEIVEQSENVGNSWHHHYDRLHLHTVKQLSHLPHLPFPEEYPLYVPRAMMVEYFSTYAKKFNISPYYNETVSSVSQLDGKWTNM